MNQSDFVELIEETLEVDAGSVQMMDDLEELGWDSLSDLGFMAELDSRLNITVNAGQLAKCKTPADLFALVGENHSDA